MRTVSSGDQAAFAGNSAHNSGYYAYVLANITAEVGGNVVNRNIRSLVSTAESNEGPSSVKSLLIALRQGKTMKGKRRVQLIRLLDSLLDRTDAFVTARIDWEAVRWDSKRRRRVVVLRHMERFPKDPKTGKHIPFATLGDGEEIRAVNFVRGWSPLAEGAQGASIINLHLPESEPGNEEPTK